MKKNIVIICSEDVPVKHLLNGVDFETFEAVGDETVFTMVRRERIKEKLPIIQENNGQSTANL